MKLRLPCWVNTAVIVLATTLLCSATHAATQYNARSPIGINLRGVAYYSSEQPFLDIFKTAGLSARHPQGWVTSSPTVYDTNEEQYLQLDQDGWPTSLVASDQDPNKPQKFTHLSVLLLFALPNSRGGMGPPYRAGHYVVLYEGEGKLTYGGDAQLISSSPGRDVLNVANPGSNGIGIRLMATDPNRNGNYLRNIRVVYAPEEELLKAGGIFRPGLIGALQYMKALRFMDWLSTNNSPVSKWEARPRVSDAGWGTTAGVPIETATSLCNTVGSDCWLNVPHQADDEYIQKMAELVHRTLSGSEQVYIEFSNEVWNWMFTQARYAVSQGKALWPNAGASDWELNRNWYGMRTAQMCDIWKSEWGSDANRVHCVMGAQVVTSTATAALDCRLWVGSGHAPCAAHGITEVAIAPYFGFDAPESWGSLNEATQLSNLFRELQSGGVISEGYPGGTLKRSADWEAAMQKAIKPYGLPLIAYEGGQAFHGFPKHDNSSWQTKLYTAANRDPRMATIYTRALSDWFANGGRLFMQFVDISQADQYGAWGSLESFMDVVNPISAAPPKWQALHDFITRKPCSWQNCAGTVSTRPEPMAPLDLRATK